MPQGVALIRTLLIYALAVAIGVALLAAVVLADPVPLAAAAPAWLVLAVLEHGSPS